MQPNLCKSIDFRSAGILPVGERSVMQMQKWHTPDVEGWDEQTALLIQHLNIASPKE